MGLILATGIKWYLYICPCNLSLLSRLFHQVTVDPATWSQTYTRFVTLLDNYQPITRMEDEQSFSKTTEIDIFLDAIIRTDVCRYLEDFLMRKGNTTFCTHKKVCQSGLNLVGLAQRAKLVTVDQLFLQLVRWPTCYNSSTSIKWPIATSS